MFDRTRPSSSQSGIGSGSGTATSERSHKPDETPSASTIAGSPPSTGCDNAAASQLRQPRAKSLLTIIAQCCSFASIIFMILVLVGNTRKVKALTNIYFLSIDVSNVIPRSYPNAVLVNSIAQTLGLRGFYQVGLWNHCEGYPNEGVTYCAPTKSMYSFDPVTILLSQLLEGATIAIPSNISDALAIAKKASHWMFGSFFVGLSFSVVGFIAGWFGHIRRRNSWIIGIISFFAGFFTTLGAIVSTVLYAVFRSVFEGAPEFNIRAHLGEQMYAFVWLSAGFSVVAFIVNAAGCCACTQRRLPMRRREKEVLEKRR